MMEVICKASKWRADWVIDSDFSDVIQGPCPPRYDMTGGSTAAKALGERRQLPVRRGDIKLLVYIWVRLISPMTLHTAS